MLALDRITFDPQIMGGRACIRGMRITVSLVLNLVATGDSPADIIEAYPYLETADIQQSIQYAAWLSEEHVHPLDFGGMMKVLADVGISPSTAP